jgi:hypothetical protein
MSRDARLTPVAAALHTRTEQHDYRWVVKRGDSRLFPEMQRLYRKLLADQDARLAPTFLLLDRGARLGLLIANLGTSRTDRLLTEIRDTLFLEFSARDRKTVFLLAASLLAEENAIILQQFQDYAEHLYRQKDEFVVDEDAEYLVFHQDYAEHLYRQKTENHSSLAALEIPLPAAAPENDALTGKPRLVLRLTEKQRQRIAELLRFLASRPSRIRYPLVVVSTGLVEQERLRRQAASYAHFYALTRSSSIPEDGESSLSKQDVVERLSQSIRALASSIRRLSQRGRTELPSAAPPAVEKTVRPLTGWQRLHRLVKRISRSEILIG